MKHSCRQHCFSLNPLRDNPALARYPEDDPAVFDPARFRLVRDSNATDFARWMETGTSEQRDGIKVPASAEEFCWRTEKWELNGPRTQAVVNAFSRRDGRAPAAWRSCGTVDSGSVPWFTLMISGHCRGTSTAKFHLKIMSGCVKIYDAATWPRAETPGDECVIQSSYSHITLGQTQAPSACDTCPRGPSVSTSTLAFSVNSPPHPVNLARRWQPAMVR